MAKKIIVSVLSVILFFVLFIGIGFLNGRRFHQQTVEHAKEVARHHFEEKGESVISISWIDSLFGNMEFDVITDEHSYYLVIQDKWSLLGITALNLAIKPDVGINYVEKRELN